jgi:hypothetical protein
MIHFKKRLVRNALQPMRNPLFTQFLLNFHENHYQLCKIPFRFSYQFLLFQICSIRTRLLRLNVLHWNHAITAIHLPSTVLPLLARNELSFVSFQKFNAPCLIKKQGICTLNIIQFDS